VPSDNHKLKEAIRLWSLYVVDDASDRMVDFARQDGPRVTGELADGIEAKPTRVTGDKITTGLVATTIQAATTDKGARAHMIFPRKPGGVLVFPGRGGGMVFAAKVAHPGNRPQRWWKPLHERRWPRALRSAARGRPLPRR
jgi:hypothetical protein